MSAAAHPDAAADRHRRAVAQTASWAREAARAGDHEEALSWIRVIETVEGSLASELQSLREHCHALLTRGSTAAKDASGRYAGRCGSQLEQV